MELTTEIRISNKEIMVRGYDNNDPYYGTGRYADYYELFIKSGGFEKKISSSSCEGPIKEEKYYLDAAINDNSNISDYPGELEIKKIAIFEAKLVLRKLECEIYELAEIMKMKKIITDLFKGD